MTPRDITNQEFQISPELRRSCWYVIAGAIVIACVVYWTATFVQGRGPADVAAVYAVLAALVFAMIAALDWKLHVEGGGIRRRRWFCWDYWSWDDFGSGRLRKKHPHTLVDADRPWWRRNLKLEALASGDREAVLAVINANYLLPPPPPLPERLTIKWGNFFRRRAALDGDGIQLIVRGARKSYLWSDVRRLLITRIDPVRRDFTSLQLALPDEEIEWKLFTSEYGTHENWRGATAEEINEFLLKYVPPGSVATFIEGEPLKDREKITEDVARRGKGQTCLPVVHGHLPAAACRRSGMDGNPRRFLAGRNRRRTYVRKFRSVNVSCASIAAKEDRRAK